MAITMSGLTQLQESIGIHKKPRGGSMTFATEEMRGFVKAVSRGLIATIDKDGYPHVTIKNGRLKKDGLLELWGVFGEETVGNLNRDPRICVTFADFDKAWGYRFKGKGEIKTSGERFEKVKGNLEKMGWTLKELITVDIESITLISQNPEEVNKKVF
ncbi:MAG: pyridoxamine 5'-phosphate oxidase family protein [Candidatus Thorarchaeota archaeon]